MADTFRPFSGARAKLFFEGNLEAGWATGIRGTERISNVRVDVLGDAFTQEIEPTGVTVTMSANFVRILRKSLRKMGIWPKNTTTADIVNWPPMSAEIYDKVGDMPILRVVGLKPSDRNFQVDRAGLFTEDASWEGIKVQDLSDL